MISLWDKYDTILFDLDGTLIDSAKDLSDSLNDILPNHGIEAVPYKFLRPFTGVGSYAMIDAVCLYYDIELERTQKEFIKQDFLEAYEKRVLNNTTPFDDAENLLSWLKNNNKRLILATNKPRHFTHIIIKHLGWEKYFSALVCSDDVKNKKPHPDHLLSAMEQAGGFSHNALMVGDTFTDYNAATQCDMDIMMVNFYNSNMRDFKKAILIIDAFAPFIPNS